MASNSETGALWGIGKWWRPLVATWQYVFRMTSFRDRDLGELHGARPAALDDGLSASRADVTHPVRTLAEHRDQVAVPVVPRDDEDVGAEAAAAPAFDPQSEEYSRRQAEARQPGPRPAHELPQTGRRQFR